jgi:hypothetical protein
MSFSQLQQKGWLQASWLMGMMMLAVTLISRCVLMGQPEGVGGLYLK